MLFFFFFFFVARYKHMYIRMHDWSHKQRCCYLSFHLGARFIWFREQFSWIIISSVLLGCIFVPILRISMSDWICEFSKTDKSNTTLIFGNAEVCCEGQRLSANVSFAGTMWEHKGRLETQYCACARARDVSNGLHQKISSTFCEEASSCSKRMRAWKIDGESISHKRGGGEGGCNSTKNASTWLA